MGNEVVFLYLKRCRRLESRTPPGPSADEKLSWAMGGLGLGEGPSVEAGQPRQEGSAIVTLKKPVREVLQR